MFFKCRYFVISACSGTFHVHANQAKIADMGTACDMAAKGGKTNTFVGSPYWYAVRNTDLDLFIDR